jgi:hypothetical protein
MARLDLDDVGAALRESVSAGAPGAAMIAAWQSLNEADPRWQALLGDITAAASQLHPSLGATASIHPDAIATALVDRQGQIAGSSDRFRAWVGDPADSPECRRLIGEALSNRASIGLVPTVDGRVVSLFAQRRALTRSWDLFTGDAAPGQDQPDRVLLVAFAPSKSSTLISRAATALGLTALETRIAEALLDAPNLAVAARSIGVGRETAKDALERAMRKARQGEALQVGAPPLFNTPSKAQAVAARYPPGSRVTVHYDPAVPASAALSLKVGEGFGPLTAYSFGGTFLAGGILILAMGL